MNKKLIEEDLNILIEKRKQVLVTYSMILFVSLIPYTAFFFVIKKVISPPPHHIVPLIIFTLIVITIFGKYFWANFQKPHLDITGETRSFKRENKSFKI